MTKDLLSGVALLGISATYYIWSNSIADSTLADEVGAGGLPRALAFLLAILGAILIARTLLIARAASPANAAASDDDEEQAKRVYEQIWDAVAGETSKRKLIQPNKSTVQRDKDPGGDYLYVLEKETQDIVKRILEQQAETG